MSRKNHYETAFEHFLRQRQILYFSNRQEYRPFKSGRSLKNFDFLVSAPDGTHWIIDVKGRCFPGGKKQKRYWKNWTTRDDLAGLLQWESLLGNNYRSLLLFAYQICGIRTPVPPQYLYRRHGVYYAFLGVDLHTYIAWSRLISPQWQTYEMPAAIFRKHAIPIHELLAPLSVIAPSFR